MSGWSQGEFTTDYDVATVRYTPGGGVKGVTRSTSDDGINQFANAMAVDKVRKRAYTTGYVSDAAFNPLDILTVRS